MFGSVEPSPAALVRAAFDLFESCFILQKYLREADASLKYLVRVFITDFDNLTFIGYFMMHS